MDQHGQRTSYISPADLPMKRKRGRPRKDENLVPGKKKLAMSGSDGVRKNNESPAINDYINHDMVGQVVTGVIEGSFDAGYLLNVKVGDTDTHLRGVVFLPGRFTPITAANDVAPHAKMYNRKEIPVPVLSQTTQLHNSVPLGQNDKQPSELKTQAPELSDQLVSTEIQTATPNIIESQSASVVVPPSADLPMNEADRNQSASVVEPPSAELPKNEADWNQSASVVEPPSADLPKNEGDWNQSASVVEPSSAELPKNEDGLSLGGNEEPEKSLEPGLRTVSPSIVAQPDHDKVIESDELLQECEVSAVITGPNFDAEAAKESKAEPASDPVVDVVPGIDNVTKEPEVQHQPPSLNLNPNELVHEEARNANLELNQTPVFTEPRVIDVAPSVEIVTNEPQVHHQPASLNLTRNELVHEEAKNPDLELNRNPVFAEPMVIDVAPSLGIVTKEPQVHHQPAGLNLTPNELVDEEAKNPDLELNQTPVIAEPPVIDVAPSIEIVAKEPQVQHEPASLNLNVNELVHPEANNPSLELNQTSVSAETTSIPSEIHTPWTLLMEGQASAKKDVDIAEAAKLDLPILNGEPASDPVIPTELGSPQPANQQ